MKLLSRKSEHREEHAPPPAPPASELFEATATSRDGAPTRVVAETVPNNRLAGDARLDPGEKEPPPEADLSISETGAHAANQKSRPISWLVVAFIAGAFLVVGLGLVFSQPWMFVAGLCAIAVGVLAGWAAGIMGDRGERRSASDEASPDAN